MWPWRWRKYNKKHSNFSELMLTTLQQCFNCVVHLLVPYRYTLPRPINCYIYHTSICAEATKALWRTAVYPLRRDQLKNRWRSKRPFCVSYLKRLSSWTARTRSEQRVRVAAYQAEDDDGRLTSSVSVVHCRLRVFFQRAARYILICDSILQSSRSHEPRAIYEGVAAPFLCAWFSTYLPKGHGHENTACVAPVLVAQRQPLW